MTAPLKEAARALRRMFQRMDRRDSGAFLSAFSAGAEIVHDDGVAQAPSALLTELVPSAPPLRRRLACFRGGSDGALAWLAYENEATFRASGGRERTLRFSETAVLRRLGTDWKIVRIHYSGTRP